MLMVTCWQYDRRLELLNGDLDELYCSGINAGVVSGMQVSDFTLSFEDKGSSFREVNDFICKYEWLGRMSPRPTHLFTARYHGLLGGVVVMDMPNAFSKLLGDGTRRIERLVSRGACASWTPPNLASALIMFSVRWMVANTRFRLFVGYSDPSAGEVGTIYQACNFYYLGANSGASAQYLLPSGRWVSDRYFRSRSVYKRLAIQYGVSWSNDWQQGDRIIFSRMPNEVEKYVRFLSSYEMGSLPCRKVQPKGKYAYVLGQDNRETSKLRRVFVARNKIFDYLKR